MLISIGSLELLVEIPYSCRRGVILFMTSGKFLESGSYFIDPEGIVWQLTTEQDATALSCARWWAVPVAMAA